MKPLTPRAFLSRRLTAAVALAACAGLLTLSAAAQRQRQEEEEPAKPKPRKVLRVEEEARPSALAADAEAEKDPDARALLQGLAFPHDELTLQNGLKLKIAPLKFQSGSRAQIRRRQTVQPFDENGRPLTERAVTSGDVASLVPYEQLALDEVEAYVRKHRGGDPGERHKAYQTVEKVLSAVLRFRESARERNERGKDDNYEASLRSQLLSAQLSALTAHADLKDWYSAYALGQRLVDAYPRDEVRDQVAAQLVRFVKQALEDNDFDAVRARMATLRELFPRSAVFSQIAGDLRDRADKLVRDAADQKEPLKAAELLRQAREIYPQLPGLDDKIVRLNNEYPILLVGVRELPEGPEGMWPGTAHTDVERQAVELMFESLITAREDDKVGRCYLPGLARFPPHVIPLGRQFDLERDAYWSNGEQVTAADVVRTWQILRESSQADLLADARTGDNPVQVSLTLRQGCLDPLSLMTFKVVPAKVPSPNHPDFLEAGKTVVGSGPFKYDGRRQGHDVFVANPYYHRANKPGRPRIREIHFLQPADPQTAFTRGELHLLLDVPTTELSKYRSLAPAVDVKTYSNRRVYFLAVNHRKPALGENLELRQALAAGIDREEILNDFFRSQSESPAPHRALYGPFPPSCWASDPDVKPFDKRLAAAKAKAGLGKAGAAKFELLYPQTDPDVRARSACERIADQLRALHIEVEPKAVSPRELYQRVEVQHDYDLAYYYHDYANDTYDLWPLFDPKNTERGGRNFLGYSDGELNQIFHQALSHRTFQDVQRNMYSIHRRVHEHLPFIPLWQLDTHVVMVNYLVIPPGFDPLVMFSRVEDWEMRKR